MNKDVIIKLSNPYSNEKEISLFGISDFDGKETNEGITVAVASNKTGSGHYISNSVAQSWLQTFNGLLKSITVKYDNTSGLPYPQKQRKLLIYEIDNNYDPTVLLGSTLIYSPPLNIGESLEIEHPISVNLESGKKYLFQIQEINVGFPSIEIVTDASGNYLEGISYINGNKNYTTDLYFEVKAQKVTNNAGIENVSGNNYTELVKSLVMNPQPFNQIKIISDNASQRLKLIEVINRDIIGSETITEALQSASFISNKDTGNITEIKLDEPLILGKDEMKYLLEPNTDVVLVFSNVPNKEKEVKVETKKELKILNPIDKIKKSELIKSFSEKEKIEKFKIISVTISTILLMFFLLRKVIL